MISLHVETVEAIKKRAELSEQELLTIDSIGGKKVQTGLERPRERKLSYGTLRMIMKEGKG